MNTELQEFFSLIGKAKKEKDDEFKSLVGEINIDSIFTQVKESVKEEKIKKEKKQKQLERQVKALESWLYSEPIKKEDKVIVEDEKEEENLPEVEEFDSVQVEENVDSEYKNEEDLQINLIEESEPLTEICEYKEHDTKENDTIDNALKILEQLKTKKEVQENTTDPEIIKIRRELEYLRNIVNAQGGGGEVRLEFLDDIDRDSAKRNNYYLKYDSLTNKWIGDPGGGGVGTQDLNQTLGYGNTSNIGLSVGIVTATYFVGDGSLLTNIGINYATTAGIATYSTTSGIATYSTSAGISTYATTAGVSTYASTAGIATFSQGLTGTPSITVNNIIATSATFSGNVSIAGTLTYEDVTNVDSIGVVTARSGVDIGSGTSASIISLQASSTETTTTSLTNIDTFSINTYRSAQYQIQISRGSSYHLTSLNVLHDGVDVYLSEYGTIRTSESLASFNADINSGNVRILVTPSSNLSTIFKISKVLTKI
jgi:hypothetical protein